MLLGWRGCYGAERRITHKDCCRTPCARRSPSRGPVEGVRQRFSWTKPVRGGWSYGDGASRRPGEAEEWQCEAALRVPDGTARAPFCMGSTAAGEPLRLQARAADTRVGSPSGGGRESGVRTDPPEKRRWPLKDLDAGEHRLVARGTEPRRGGKQSRAVGHGVHRRIGRQIGGRRTGLHRLSRLGEQPTSAAVSEDAVVANPHEASGQDVQEKPARELGQRELLVSDPTPAIVLEAKAHPPVVEGDEPVVGDGDPVGIAPPPAGTTQCRCG